MICKICREAADAFHAGIMTKEEAELEHAKCAIKQGMLKHNDCFCQHKLNSKVISLDSKKPKQPFRDSPELPQQNALDNKLSA